MQRSIAARSLAQDFVQSWSWPSLARDSDVQARLTASDGNYTATMAQRATIDGIRVTERKTKGKSGASHGLDAAPERPSDLRRYRCGPQDRPSCDHKTPHPHPSKTAFPAS